MVRQLSSVLLIGPKPERKVKYSCISIDSFYLNFPTIEAYKRMKIGDYDCIIALSDDKWSMKQAEKTSRRLAERNIRVPIVQTHSSELYDLLQQLNEGKKLKFDRWNHNILRASMNALH